MNVRWLLSTTKCFSSSPCRVCTKGYPNGSYEQEPSLLMSHNEQTQVRRNEGRNEEMENGYNVRNDGEIRTNEESKEENKN